MATLRELAIPITRAIHKNQLYRWIMAVSETIDSGLVNPLTRINAGASAGLSARRVQSFEWAGGVAQCHLTMPAAPSDGDVVWLKNFSSTMGFAPLLISPGDPTHALEDPAGTGPAAPGADVTAATAFAALLYVFRSTGLATPVWRLYA